jgi:hypothetical protein
MKGGRPTHGALEAQELGAGEEWEVGVGEIR